jgi:hypothetical protein
MYWKISIYAALCDGSIEEDETNYAPLGRPKPNTNLLRMKVVLHLSRWKFSLAQIREI